MASDDWDFSAEELDSLEKDAMRKIAERTSSSATASISSSRESEHNKAGNSRATARVLPPSMAAVDTGNSCATARVLPPSMASVGTGNTSAKDLPKLWIKLFLHASGDIAAKFQYNPILVEAIRNVPKAVWHAKERLWMFPLSSLSSAEKILSEINGANVEVEKLDHLVRRAIASASDAPDLRGLYDRMPSSIESRLLPFQRDGVRFALQHGGRVLLADEMGLGKTLQAIAFTACVPESWPVLVLAPSSLRLHWAAMIQQWMDIPPADIVVVLSQSTGSNRAGFTIISSSAKGAINLDGVFNIISYDSVSKLQPVLMASQFKIVIADESHFLKNAQAKRTTSSLPVLQKAQYVILLSGTPALSRPIELFKQLEAMYPDVYKNVHEYGNRYCKGGMFGMYQGASNHVELHNLMKATVMIRRLKKDVLSELPVKRRQQVFLELAEKEMKLVNALFKELSVLKEKIKSCTSKEEIDSLKFIQKNLINKIYTDSAEAKIPAVLDYLATIIEAGCKFLIFAHHQSMVDKVHQFLLKKKVDCIRIDGGTPASSRQSLVNDFQEKDNIRAAVLSIKAGGVGLTLTAASTVIFAELSWTPGDLIQAEDRAHRIGQASAVNVYYLLANDTIDDIIWDVVQSKLDNLGQMLDGHEKTLQVAANPTKSSPTEQKTLDSFMTNPTKSSPVKQKTLDSFMTNPTKSSPVMQKTLDSFMKRCNSSTNDTDDASCYPNIKHPRI